VNTFGLQGELKLLLNPDFSDVEFKKNALVEISGCNYSLAKYRKIKNLLRFSLNEFQDINQVLGFIGCLVSIEPNQLQKPPTGEVYSFQVLGFSVIDQFDLVIGEIVKVENTGWQRILRVTRLNKKEALIPWVDNFVKDINFTKKTVKVQTIEGLI